ncbi:MAG: hypothetical protein WCQ80_02425 [Bacilli bacterium]
MFRFKTAARMRFVSRVGLGLTALAISVLLLFSYYGQRVGSFTVDLNQEMYINKSIELSESIDFTTGLARLNAESIKGVDPIGVRGDILRIPLEVESALSDIHPGNNNGDNFLMYSFYIRNSGNASLAYTYTIYLEEASNNVDSAIRVMVIKASDVMGENPTEISEIFAKVQGENNINPGQPELGTTRFAGSKIVTVNDAYNFKVNQIDQYIVIMWIHGEDIDCTDVGDSAIVEGKIRLSMKFSILDF